MTELEHTVDEAQAPSALPAPAPPPPPARARAVAGRAAELLRANATPVAFVALFVTLSVASDAFLTKANLLNLLDQNAAIGIIACAMTLVIVAGGFDLSVGAIFAIAGVVAAKVALSSSPLLGILAAVAAGAALGLGNGLLVTVGRINSFIGTLATSYVIRGLALVISSGFLITVTDPGFTTLGAGKLGDVTYGAIAFVAVAIALAVLLHRSVFGRHVYAAGDNPEAARLSGVPVMRTRTITFVLSGACAGLAGVIVASRVATGQADSGVGLELSAIAAVVIGGTSIAGGEGAVWRTAIGVFLLALISNGFNLLNVDPVYQQIVQGAIIAIAVGADAWSRKRR
jgi:ribose transport system permease protein